MGEEIIKSMFAVATALVGVAIIAVLVSRNAATSQVIQSAAGGFATAVGAAVSPVTGGSGLGFGGFSGGASLPSYSF